MRLHQVERGQQLTDQRQDRPQQRALIGRGRPSGSSERYGSAALVSSGAGSLNYRLFPTVHRAGRHDQECCGQRYHWGDPLKPASAQTRNR
jgi:hypothetical protein